MRSLWRGRGFMKRLFGKNLLVLYSPFNLAAGVGAGRHRDVEDFSGALGEWFGRSIAEDSLNLCDFSFV